MDIIQIQEKYFSHSYNAHCYKVDIQELYGSILLVDSYDSKFKKFIKALKTERIRFMVLVDELNTIYLLDDKGEVGVYNIGDRYSLVFDEVVNNSSRRITLNKDSWDDYIAETMWIDFELEDNELAIVKGVKEFKPKLFGKKDKITRVSKNSIKDKLKNDTSFVCAIIVALLEEIKAIVYWEEDRVLALQFNTNSMLPLNLNNKTFDNLLHYIKAFE